MKLTDWLVKKYLPNWAVLEYQDALEAAQAHARELEVENRTLRAYIACHHWGAGGRAEGHQHIGHAGGGAGMVRAVLHA